MVIVRVWALESRACTSICSLGSFFVALHPLSSLHLFHLHSAYPLPLHRSGTDRRKGDKRPEPRAMVNKTRPQFVLQQFISTFRSQRRGNIHGGPTTTTKKKRKENRSEAKCSLERQARWISTRAKEKKMRRPMKSVCKLDFKWCTSESRTKRVQNNVRSAILVQMRICLDNEIRFVLGCHSERDRRCVILFLFFSCYYLRSASTPFTRAHPLPRLGRRGPYLT